MDQPTRPEELAPPVGVVGRAGWEGPLRRWLEEFGCRLWPPATEAMLAQAEADLGRPLPADWRSFLATLGPSPLGDVHFLPPAQIRPVTDVWFRDLLSPADQARLATLWAVADTGSDGLVVYDTVAGRYGRCRHDPPEPADWCPTFSDLLRLVLLAEWCGRGGWPDDDLERMVADLSARWLARWAAEA